MAPYPTAFDRLDTRQDLYYIPSNVRCGNRSSYITNRPNLQMFACMLPPRCFIVQQRHSRDSSPMAQDPRVPLFNGLVRFLSVRGRVEVCGPREVASDRERSGVGLTTCLLHHEEPLVTLDCL